MRSFMQTLLGWTIWGVILILWIHLFCGTNRPIGNAERPLFMVL